MKRVHAQVRVLAALAFVISLWSGCNAIFGISPIDKILDGGGGAGGATTSTTSTGGCTNPGQCMGSDGPCATRTCKSGVCGVDFVPNGQSATMQTPGDCKKVVCDGKGAGMDLNDDTDVPDDKKGCTSDACSAGTPSNTPVMAGTACTAPDMGVCNGLGDCVAC